MWWQLKDFNNDSAVNILYTNRELELLRLNFQWIVLGLEKNICKHMA